MDVSEVQRSGCVAYGAPIAIQTVSCFQCQVSEVDRDVTNDVKDAIDSVCTNDGLINPFPSDGQVGCDIEIAFQTKILARAADA